jgi:hypothetical protein
MFELTLLPASDGDCLLLSYGNNGAMNHVLVDGGRTGAYASLKPFLNKIGKRQQRIELLVLSHIDADHIEGVLALASDNELPVGISEIWFNGFDQLSSVRPMGPAQADRFSKAIRARGWTANARFGGRALAISGQGGPDVIKLPGGLKLTLLSPDASRLNALWDDWKNWRTKAAARAAEEAIRRAAAPGLQMMGLRPFPLTIDLDTLADGPETIDAEVPNGSSIAFIAEWDNKRVMLGADAHPDLLAQSIRSLAGFGGGRYAVDLYKVSHHGSGGNTTRELVSLLDCRRFAISTNGSRHGHPHPETIAKLIKYSPRGDGDKVIYFNYRQERTTPWHKLQLEQRNCYRCEFSNTNGCISIPI